MKTGIHAEVLQLCKPRSQREPKPPLMREVFRRFGNWCHCAGRGYWYEQVDGTPHNRSIVKCDEHWKPEMQDEAESGR